MNSLQSLSAPAGRFFLSLIFVLSGIGKIGTYSATQGYMESVGVPGLLLPAVIVLEVVGGLAVMLGWKTRIAAFLLAGFSLLSAIMFHADFGDQLQSIMFLKNLSLAGGFLILVAFGPGTWSIDQRVVS
jgi:putative oxidoreductase